MVTTQPYAVKYQVIRWTLVWSGMGSGGTVSLSWSNVKVTSFRTRTYFRPPFEWLTAAALFSIRFMEQFIAMAFILFPWDTVRNGTKSW